MLLLTSITVFAGVGPRIEKKWPMALPFWCCSHQLNRVIVNASALQIVRNSIGTADKIVKFFDNSPQREHLLKEEIKSSSVDKDSKPTKTKLQRFCKTRWVERHDAYDQLVELLPCVVSTLETLKDTFSRREAMND